MTGAPQVVLVEDDAIDTEAVRRTFTRRKLPARLVRFQDGDEALAAARRGEFERPCLFVIDLNLPRMPGLELLEALDRLAYLGDCEAVVLTTSSAESDRAHAHRLGASAYLSKSDRGALDRLGDLIEDFARRHVRTT